MKRHVWILVAGFAFLTLPLWAQQKSCCPTKKEPAQKQKKEGCVICKVKKCKIFKAIPVGCAKCAAKKCPNCKAKKKPCCPKCAVKTFNPKCSSCQVAFVVCGKHAKVLAKAYAGAKVKKVGKCTCPKDKSGKCGCVKKGQKCNCGDKYVVRINYQSLPAKCQKCLQKTFQGKSCGSCKKGGGKCAQ